VLGEAPESDSEDELNVSDGVAVTQLPDGALKGAKIAGEAPESDDETLGMNSLEKTKLTKTEESVVMYGN